MDIHLAERAADATVSGAACGDRSLPADAQQKADVHNLSAWSHEELVATIKELTVQLDRFMFQWLLVARELDIRQCWEPTRFYGCAHFLAFHCGLSVRTVQERLRVAHALTKLPEISAAMENGTLSYSKVRAVSKIYPHETEETLLELALRKTASEVEHFVHSYRRSESDELAREQQQRDSRNLTHYYDESGSLVLRARLTAEDGALFVKALKTAQEQLRQQAPPAAQIATDGPTRVDTQQADWDARTADALRPIMEAFLKGTPALSTPSGRNLLVLHVDEATLREGAQGRCHLENGPAVAAETARRFGCDTTVQLLVENQQGHPLNIGRQTRTIPPEMRRALEARDHGRCRFPGCTNSNTSNLHGHHIKFWAEGGETSITNIALLCYLHHHAVHEGGYKIEPLPNGDLRFYDPQGQPLQPTPTSPQAPERL